MAWPVIIGAIGNSYRQIMYGSALPNDRKLLLKRYGLLIVRSFLVKFRIIRTKTAKTSSVEHDEPDAAIILCRPTSPRAFHICSYKFWPLVSIDMGFGGKCTIDRFLY